MFTFWLTTAGLVLVLAGIALGLRAYVLDHAEHGTGPLWPMATRTRHAVIRAARRVFGRPRHAVIAVEGRSSATVFGTATVTVSGPEIDETRPIEKQVASIIQRLKNLENATRAGEERVSGELSEIRKDLTSQVTRLDGADEQLRQAVRSVAVGTAKLQIQGLILVGVGTGMMAIPTLLSSI